jgi:hypothetical protein
MRDLIAERDKKEKMEHSIVKWWNVHYTTPEELEQVQKQQEQEPAPTAAYVVDHSQSMPERASGESEAEEMQVAQEIIDRLNREAMDDEAALQREIEQAKQEAEANYNETTGAPSGIYGSQGADEEHQEQIDAILAEKDDALRDLIERTEETE